MYVYVCVCAGNVWKQTLTKCLFSGYPLLNSFVKAKQEWELSMAVYFVGKLNSGLHHLRKFKIFVLELLLVIFNSLQDPEECCRSLRLLDRKCKQTNSQIDILHFSSFCRTMLHRSALIYLNTLYCVYCCAKPAWLKLWLYCNATNHMAWEKLLSPDKYILPSTSIGHVWNATSL